MGPPILLAGKVTQGKLLPFSALHINYIGSTDIWTRGSGAVLCFFVKPMFSGRTFAYRLAPGGNCAALTCRCGFWGELAIQQSQGSPAPCAEVIVGATE